jgi:hypothetical protein
MTTRLGPWGLVGLTILAACGDGEWSPEDGPRAVPLPGCAPAPLPSTGDPLQDCVDRINQLRHECQGLAPLARWTDGEACAEAQAAYDAAEGQPHAGFEDDICSPLGRAQNACPAWDSVEGVLDRCLQLMWDEGPGRDFAEHGHYLNMTDPSHTRVACAFHTVPSGTREGQVWAVQNFE